MTARRYRIDSPIGWLGIGLDAGDRLSAVDFLHGRPPPWPDLPSGHPVTQALAAYFESARQPEGVELAAAPTAFQARVRAALLAIPPGQTRTYGELAAVLGSAPRAVGQACRRNPLPLFVPCHRVVAADGAGGFGGHRDGPVAALKRRLLEHERTRA
ncbi:methylated-DNA--[protein]-cysteine S-methyltransferase [Thiohalobacter sp.]|uniref:methylated-DNA--[protein]-cysteine S-methyltransferase n=1 Tax=Thiohalobacter sp. TaxID=2025948 RepID=UPI00262569EA|nr:methylated-DNA--[protein]-cysteine S-methyltransferase [Thiohalobacter sp.]